MNTALLAADIARRIPEMKRDSALNNTLVIQTMIEAELRRSREASWVPSPHSQTDHGTLEVEFNDGLKFPYPPGALGRLEFERDRPRKPTWAQFWKAAATCRRIKLGARTMPHPREGWDRNADTARLVAGCSLEVCKRRPVLHLLCVWTGYY